MSKIILDGFKTDVTHEDQDAILIRNILWYDKINGLLKVGNKQLNYYFDDIINQNVYTVLTQSELPAKNVLPVEFTIIEKI